MFYVIPKALYQYHRQTIQQTSSPTNKVPEPRGLSLTTQWHHNIVLLILFSWRNWELTVLRVHLFFSLSLHESHSPWNVVLSDSSHTSFALRAHLIYIFLKIFISIGFPIIIPLYFDFIRSICVHVCVQNTCVFTCLQNPSQPQLSFSLAKTLSSRWGWQPLNLGILLSLSLYHMHASQVNFSISSFCKLWVVGLYVGVVWQALYWPSS